MFFMTPHFLKFLNLGRKSDGRIIYLQRIDILVFVQQAKIQFNWPLTSCPNQTFRENTKNFVKVFETFHVVEIGEKVGKKGKEMEVVKKEKEVVGSGGNDTGAS